MKLLHTSDLHIDERGRLADVELVLEEIVETALRHEVDLIVVAGDHFDRKSTPTERNVLARFFQAACEVAPVVSVRGNHDQPGDLDIFQKLETENRLYIFDLPTFPAPRIVFHHRGVVVAVLALPWFDKTHLAASAAASEGQLATTTATIAAARGLLDSLRHEADRQRAAGCVPVLVTHVMLGGSVVSTGQILIGQGVELSPSDLANVGCEYVAAGHVHQHQSFYSGRVAYSGSPHRVNFGEPEAKGCCLVTFDDSGRFLQNEFVELPARRMVLLECDWTGENARKLQDQSAICLGIGPQGWKGEDLKGALVRFRYHVRAQDLHLVNEPMIQAVLEADGAAEVQLEAIVESETRARAPEIVEARTTQAKVEAWLTATQIPTDEAQRARLAGKLGELEAVQQ